MGDGQNRDRPRGHRGPGPSKILGVRGNSALSARPDCPRLGQVQSHTRSKLGFVLHHDAIVFRLPVVLDQTGQAFDIALAAQPPSSVRDQAVVLRLARAAESIDTAQAALGSGLATAFEETDSSALRALQPDVSALRQLLGGLLTRIDEAIRTGTVALTTPSDAQRTRSAALVLSERLSSELDALLRTRISVLGSRASRVGLASLLSVLLVVVIVILSYRSMSARRRALTYAALVRQAASDANKAEDFHSVAATVLQDVCTRLGWLAGHAWTTTGDSAVWHIAGHPHSRMSPCHLAVLAEQGAAPSTEMMPLDNRTRIADTPGDLPGLGAARDACMIESAVAVPVLAGGAAAGMLAFYLPAGIGPLRADLIAALEQIGVNLGQVVERQRAAAVLLHQATHDVVTDVANRRRLLEEIVDTQRKLASREAGDGRSAVLLINLDRFRSINDALGFAAGDTVLHEAATRICRAVTDDDLVARLSADEFVVLTHGGGESVQGDHTDPFLALAYRIQQHLGGLVDVSGHQISMRASVGICELVAGDSESVGHPTGVLRDADIALRHAKRRGKDQIQVFDATLRDIAEARILDETALAQAIVNDELVLHYQPIIDFSTESPVGAEALVRWMRPGHGLVPPNRFIPLAEEGGLIVDLGRWVLRRACRDAAAWPQTAPAFASATISVNVSTRQLTHPRFLADLDAALHDGALPPSRLIVEITETALIQDPDAVMTTLHAIRARGVKLALDDFGTGYSSMSYVQNLPVSILKIDKSFVDPISGPGQGTTLTEVVLKLAEATGLQTVAEGVESAAQAEALRRLGCDRGQGFLWSPPVRNSQLTTALTGTFEAAEA